MDAFRFQSINDDYFLVRLEPDEFEPVKFYKWAKGAEPLPPPTDGDFWTQINWQGDGQYAVWLEEALINLMKSLK